MNFTSKRRRAAAVLLALPLALSACSVGSIGSSSGDEGKTTITYLVGNDSDGAERAESLAQAFMAKNSDIDVKVEARPGGAEGDNIVKTRLSTGDMADVFLYNSGSLFQAINPRQNLVPLTNEPFMANVQETYRPVVSVGSDVYGVPATTAMGGGVLYNKKVYAQLGLQVPTTWDQFMANNAKVKAANITPVIQTYQTTWTSQLFVLADFHNVMAADAWWAEKYTANKVKYAGRPAIQGFEHLQQVHQRGYLNKDFASATLENGLRMVATGKGAHYPMLTDPVATIVRSFPEQAKDVGFFALPGDQATTNGLTLWMPNAAYIPTSTTGAKLDAAKKFLAFLASPEGCDALSKTSAPTGPYLIKDCKLPDDVPPAVKDVLRYVEKSDATSPALEFLSPVKGPALEQICVEVGSGIRSAEAGAALYDKDVQKQAQQLALPGW